jgi:hypothetical protein
MDPEQLLAPLRDADPSSPSRVNVHRAVHAGARRVWLRRVGSGVAVFVVVVPFAREPAVVPPASSFDVLRQVVRLVLVLVRGHGR